MVCIEMLCFVFVLHFPLIMYMLSPPRLQATNRSSALKMPYISKASILCSYSSFCIPCKHLHHPKNQLYQLVNKLPFKYILILDDLHILKKFDKCRKSSKAAKKKSSLPLLVDRQNFCPKIGNQSNLSTLLDTSKIRKET